MPQLSIFAVDPEDRRVRGTYFFYVQATLFTSAFHGPPSGIQVSLTLTLSN